MRPSSQKRTGLRDRDGNGHLRKATGDPRRWDTARLTARGGGARAEAAEVRAFPDGTHIILK